MRPAPARRPPGILLAGAAALALVGATASPGRAQAVEGCDLRRSRLVESLAAGRGFRITFFSGPVEWACRDGVRVRADSAVYRESTAVLQLIGAVRYRETGRTLDSERLDYFRRQERIVAWGDVRLEERGGESVITGDTLRYLRTAPERPEEELVVTGERPHALLRPAAEPERAGAGSAPDTAAAVLDTVRPEPEPADSVRGRLPIRGERGEPRLAAPEREDTLAGDTLAGDTLPGDTLPGDTASGEDVPGDTVPGDTVPGESAAVDEAASVPEDTVRTPYEVDADRIVLRGSSYFEATGRAVIRRDQLTGYADTAVYRQGIGELALRDTTARVEAEGYRLSGGTVTLRLPADVLEDVTARPRAHLVGDGFEMRAPEVRLFVTPSGALDRLVAVREGGLGGGEVSPGRPGRGGGRGRAGLVEEAADVPDAGEAATDTTDAWPRRPEAEAQGFLLRADSMEVLTPEEVLDRLIAVGGARGESLEEAPGRLPPAVEEVPDVARRDWIAGDTVTGHFVPDSPAGAAGEAPVEEADDDGDRVRLETLVARGNARSFYRMESRRADASGASEGAGGSEGEAAEPCLSLHYATGAEIRIRFAGGEPDVVRVEGGTKGLHMEPVCPGGSEVAGREGPP